MNELNSVLEILKEEFEAWRGECEARRVLYQAAWDSYYALLSEYMGQGAYLLLRELREPEPLIYPVQPTGTYFINYERVEASYDPLKPYTSDFPF